MCARRRPASQRRPRVYFEEWDEPMISGIRWVSELIGIAGGDDCFADTRSESLGKDRIIADPLEVVRRAPDLILGSWCGKKFRPETVAARAGLGSGAGGARQRSCTRSSRRSSCSRGRRRSPTACARCTR